MTDEEKKLWYHFLVHLPVTVSKQKVLGHYIIDFYVASHKLAIEIDGHSHYTYAGHMRDEQRTKYLNSLGIKVIRYSNHDVSHHFEKVCDSISNHIFHHK